jgi:hypothetical protein
MAGAYVTRNNTPMLMSKKGNASLTTDFNVTPLMVAAR